MGDCQRRSGEGQTRHMYLVFLASSALMRQLQHDRAQEWAHARLTTIGKACRMLFRETLSKTLDWVVDRTKSLSENSVFVYTGFPDVNVGGNQNERSSVWSWSRVSDT